MFVLTFFNPWSVPSLVEIKAAVFSIDLLLCPPEQVKGLLNAITAATWQPISMRWPATPARCTTGPNRSAAPTASTRQPTAATLRSTWSCMSTPASSSAPSASTPPPRSATCSITSSPDTPDAQISPWTSRRWGCGSNGATERTGRLINWPQIRLK